MVHHLLQNNPDTFQTDDLKTFHYMDGMISIGDNFNVNISKGQLTVNSHTYQIMRNPGHIGGGLWLSSVGMLYLITKSRHIFEGKRVLELGAGLGIPSMYVSQFCNPLSVTASDEDIENLQDSISANNQFNNTRLNITQVDWNDSPSHRIKYDVIIVSDCVYRSTQKSLFHAISSLLEDDGKFIVCNPDREGLDDFLYAMQEAYDNTSISQLQLIYNKDYVSHLVTTQNIEP